MGSRAITEICSPANTHRMILTLTIEMITHGQLLTVPRWGRWRWKSPS